MECVDLKKGEILGFSGLIGSGRTDVFEAICGLSDITSGTIWFNGDETRFASVAQARDAGMQAIVFMDVFEMSNGTAWLVNRVVPDFQTFGGLILNTVYGGMNPRAVKTAIYYGAGAKYISFGAHSTYYQAAREGRLVDGKFVPLSELYPKFRTEELDRCIRIPLDEAPTPELDEILQLIAAHPHIYLNTGHVSPAEAVRLGGLKVTDPQDVYHANYPLAAVIRPGRNLHLELRYDGRRVEDAVSVGRERARDDPDVGYDTATGLNGQRTDEHEGRCRGPCRVPSQHHGSC